MRDKHIVIIWEIVGCCGLLMIRFTAGVAETKVVQAVVWQENHAHERAHHAT